MVDITNGIHVMRVTKGAYEGIYKHQGYTLMNDNASGSRMHQNVDGVSDEGNSIAEVETSPAIENESSVKVFEMPELLEKPIGQWTKDEVKEFASANDISLSGTKNVTEAKERIKAAIDA